MAAPKGRTARRQAQIEAFVRNRLAGMSQIDAWRDSGVRWRHLSEDSQHRQATLLASLPQTVSRYHNAIKQAQVTDLITPGQWTQQLLADLEQARATGNYTAVMAGSRLTGQASGAIREGSTVNVGVQISDGQIAKLIAGQDQDLLAKLSGLLGAASFDDDTVETLPKPNPE